MAWTKLREKLETEARKGRLSYYDKQIRELYQAGFRLADAEMETEYTRLVEIDQETQCILYLDGRNSTNIQQTKPNEYGLYGYATHARSEHIDEAIKALAELHAKDIVEEKAWLMPVIDDDEYVSWYFDIAVGTRDEVLALLRAAQPQK